MRWLGVAILCAAFVCNAQADGGGRDVSVALFSAQPAHSVVVVPAGPGAWWAACGTCAHRPITTPLRMPNVREIVAGGALTVRDEEHSQSRTFNGKWHLRSEGDGIVRVVLSLPSEKYVAAVLMGETAPGDPQESLRAMAVVARTFVLRTDIARAPSALSHLPSDTCDSTACQAMKLGPVSDAVYDAVRSTAGETLWYRGQRAQVFFSGSCGGTTESAAAIWPTLKGVPYLRSIADPYCVRKDRAAWHAEIPLRSIEEIALLEGWHIPLNIVSATVAEETSSQRARAIAFSSADGRKARVSAPALRLAVGRSLGWNLIRGDAYDLRVRDGLLVFDGHGHGHGVGLCQQGATEMARTGRTYRDILGFYFAGTTVGVTRSDIGWRQSAHGGIALASTGALAPAVIAEAVNAWSYARSQFAVGPQIMPSITFAPTTEIFRQLTSQPGWQLASTSRTRIVLQPQAVLAANRVSLAETLRHEMLHVAVEAVANRRAPLWLREGLVEVLDGEAVHTAPSLSADDTERLLLSPSSRQQSQAAHIAAGARTHALVQRYGLSAVRGWLTAGSSIPAE